MYNSILVPLDRSSAAEAALPVADKLASRIGAKIELILSSALGLDIEEHEKYLEGVAVRLNSPVVGTEVISADNVVDSILDALHKRTDALLCMSTHGRGGLGQALMGSTAEAVVRGAQAPVLLVGPDISDQEADLSSIQVCLDGSTAAEELVDIAASWSQELKARLWLVEVQDPKSNTSGQDVVDSGYLTQLGESLRHRGIDAEWDVLHDKNPHKALVDFNQHQPVSLIMIATHGRSGFRRAAMGSVAMHVVRHAKTPVLIYHPTGAVED